MVGISVCRISRCIDERLRNADSLLINLQMARRYVETLGADGDLDGRLFKKLDTVHFWWHRHTSALFPTSCPVLRMTIVFTKHHHASALLFFVLHNAGTSSDKVNREQGSGLLTDAVDRNWYFCSTVVFNVLGFAPVCIDLRNDQVIVLHRSQPAHLRDPVVVDPALCL
jgi:hypothetical protein